jgi:hypothetical protein
MRYINVLRHGKNYFGLVGRLRKCGIRFARGGARRAEVIFVVISQDLQLNPIQICRELL